MVKMNFRVSPLLWPALACTTPVTVPLVLLKTWQFRKNQALADKRNQDRLDRAVPLDLPELEFLELIVLEDWLAEEGFRGAPGVSYLLRTDRGSLLFDVGYGPKQGVAAQNALKLGVKLDQVEALAISHLHLDHMGGMPAQRARQVVVPKELGPPGSRPCYLPDRADAGGFQARVVDRPTELAAGMASTGPLARALFFFGLIEEQALVANLRGKGLVVITGCGHPTVQLILQMVRRVSSLPVHALVGGLHYPVTAGRGGPRGVQPQMIFGTGKPLWRPITDRDLSGAIACINEAGTKRLLLSAHDTCDHALGRFGQECRADVEVLRAGSRYRL
jgi:7,8-dihydropterin-6-yl-methyl-4-(beta-D-ribofuranosyl)aminobenzene 5'-phosphate synthase